MPEGVTWTEPAGGFLTWLTLPEELDTVALRPAAIAAGVAYVPGPPFYVGEGGANELRLSFSHLGGPELEAAVERLAGVVRSALDQSSAPRDSEARRRSSVRRSSAASASSRAASSASSSSTSRSEPPPRSR